MPYTITGPRDRCPVSTHTGGRCALRDGHRDHHVTVDGGHFAQPGDRPGQWVAKLVPVDLSVADFQRNPWAQQPPSTHREDALRYAFTRPQQGIRCGAPEPGTSATRAGVRCQKPLYHAGDHHNAAGVSWAGASSFRGFTDGYNATVAQQPAPTFTPAQVDAYVKAVTAAIGQEQSHLGNRVVALVDTVKAMERQLVALGTPSPTRGGLTTLTDRVDQLATRLTELEQDTSTEKLLAELNNRVAALETRRDHTSGYWNASSPEPPREGRYQDSRGAAGVFIWTYRADVGEWGYTHTRPDTEGEWTRIDTWAGLTEGEGAAVADFPWVRV